MLSVIYFVTTTRFFIMETLIFQKEALYSINLLYQWVIILSGVIFIVIFFFWMPYRKSTSNQFRDSDDILPPNALLFDPYNHDAFR